MSILVSVIIPTFNRKGLLLPTIRSVLSQTTSLEFEVLVVDSGNDGTELALRREFGEGVRYLRIPDSKNRSRLRNVGAQNAQGEWLLFLDNDMLMTSSHLSTHWEWHQARESRSGVSMSRRRALVEFNPSPSLLRELATGSEVLEPFAWISDFRDRFLQSPDVMRNPIPWRFSFSHNMMMHRSLFESVGGFQEDFGEAWGYEDLELGLRLVSAGAQFALLSDPPIYHQPHLEQSRAEQPLGSGNAVRLAKGSGRPEVELVARWGCAVVDGAEISVLRHQDRQEVLQAAKGFDLVVGVAAEGEFTTENPWRLGVFLQQFAELHFDSLLISRQFELHGPTVRLAILMEARRVGKEIFVETDGPGLRSTLAHLGWGMRAVKVKKGLKLHFTEETLPRILTLVVPSAFDPVRRAFWLRLALALDGAGFLVNLIEPRGGADSPEPFGGFDDDQRNKLHIMQQGKNLGVGNRTLMSVELLQGKLPMTPGPGSFFVDDLGFDPHVSSRSPWPVVPTELVNAFLAEPRQAVLSPRTDLATSMFSGYAEDNIEAVLDLMVQHRAKGFQEKLRILLPELTVMTAHCYYRHNAASRRLHLGPLVQRCKIDRSRLETALRERNLESMVDLICVRDDGELALWFQKTRVFLSLTAGKNLGVLVPGALNNGCQVLLAGQVPLSPGFGQEVTRVAMEPVPFHEHFDLPSTTAIYGWVAWKVKDLGQLLVELRSDLSANDTARRKPENMDENSDLVGFIERNGAS